MSVTVMILLKRKPGLTPEQFRQMYESGHSRLGLKHFGHLWKAYRRYYLGGARPLATAAGFPTEGEGAQICPYDAITEVVYRDMAALEENNRLMTETELGQIMAEDEERIFDRPNSWGIVCDVVEDDPASAAAAAGNIHLRP